MYCYGRNCLSEIYVYRRLCFPVLGVVEEIILYALKVWEVVFAKFS